MKKYVMRKPRVENKYNLTIKDCKKLQVGDRAKIKSPLFWRNTAINAWCISEDIGTDADKQFGTDNSYWIGIYDEDAKAYAGKLKISFSTYGGMCGYNFNSFFKEKDIENELDLITQEKFLEKINYLIDEGILTIDK
jgi:hypothetical protein